MADMLNSLKEIIALNDQEQFISFDVALSYLDEQFGDDLINELSGCLTHYDPEVRKLAVELLIEARPQSLPSLPDLIERLRNDDDKLVQVAVLTGIGEFGELAVLAIDGLHPWLDSEDEYLRILAATAIMDIDPYRTELLPDIRAALKGEDPMVRKIAREFIGRTKASMAFDEEAFRETVTSNWHYHAPAEQVHWMSSREEDCTWRVETAPVFQEIFGGEDDGMRVWSGFEFHLQGFSHEPGVEVLDYGAMSRSADHEPIPFIGISGRYFGESFSLRIGLEPLPDSEPQEVVDTVRQVIRPINDGADDAQASE